MAQEHASTVLGQQVSLGTLLAETVNGVVEAQRRLDEDALSRVTQFVATPQGETALPPLWYTFSDVTLQVELAASVTRVGPQASRLDCRLVNPAAVSLFGYSASTSVKVTLRLAPREVATAAPFDSI
jgi:hypothetical protein